MANQYKRATYRLVFRLRPIKPGTDPQRPRSLYIRLTVNKIVESDYVSGVKVRTDQWNKKSQCATGHSEEVRLINNQLQHIRNQHAALFEQQLRSLKAPTGRSVKDAWTTPIKAVPLLIQAGNAHVAYLKSLKGTSEALAPTTIVKRRNGVVYLKKFIQAHHQKAKDVPLTVVTIGWAKSYLVFLAGLKKKDGTPRMARNTAVRYVMLVESIFDYLIEQGDVEINPLTTLRLKREPGKVVTFMEDIHLQRLANLDLLPPLGVIRDVALLLCYTGLDLLDLRRFLKQPAYFLTTTLNGGKKIVIARGKTQSDCHIPVLPGVLALIERYSGVRLPTEQHINRSLKLFQMAIGFPHTLTAKICRKTAGTLFLNAGYSIEVVSQILGHSSTRTTERHYTRITNKRIDAEMSRVGTFTVPLSQTNRTA